MPQWSEARAIKSAVSVAKHNISKSNIIDSSDCFRLYGRRGQLLHAAVKLPQPLEKNSPVYPFIGRELTHRRQVSSVGGGPLAYPPLPSPPLLPQRVRAEPGRQTVVGEFRAENFASSSNDLRKLSRK